MHPALFHRSGPLAHQTMHAAKETGRSSHRKRHASNSRAGNVGAGNDNDGTCRKTLWKRLEGDSWEAFDALPRSIRLRLTEHVYDAWSVNTLALWQHYKRVHGANERAERALIRYLDYCERLEQQAFAERHGALPHQAAGATPLRYGPISQD
ncbi:DUF6525 family protein [Asaia lannensis]|uniref:DUF6525 family protein n=1 Tax=Asaia lannensis NBRC 102526 TaxID=1307926 RepID=A0ABT1CE51_9PROT|nr:DUF6525 family protein [Asaia lannensis]MCO6159123.1 DUF6525 family protein [Asaia lannensis NBRC 102526]